MGYVYIWGTILFTVYGQLILKWRIARYGALPEESISKLLFVSRLLIDPFIISCFVSAFIASLFWMAAMTKFSLSYAYPFMSASFVIVFIFSVVLFNDMITLSKIVGLALIVLGILISSR